jgi:hypothetical protein
MGAFNVNDMRTSDTIHTRLETLYLEKIGQYTRISTSQVAL